QMTKIQKRNIGFYSNGTYDKDKGYILDAVIFGQPFRYYRWGNDVYLSEEEKWRKVAPTQAPMEPFADFSKLLFLADRAVQLPDEVLLSKKCSVYELTLGPADAINAARSMGLDLSENKETPSGAYFEKMNMKYKIWVGQKDNFIYQYKTETTMPVPDAGSLYQEVFFKFWDYNSSTVNVPGPEKIEPYLIKN
ncbi:MAG: hypothetical protein ACYC21_16095, partial [Eubacteriales bacterium]